MDFSSTVHRMIFTSVKSANPGKRDGKFITEEFIGLTLDMIISEMIQIQMQHKSTYGDLVILLDDWSKGYWRKDVFRDYKMGRSAGREESEINYKEVFKYINELTDMFEKHTPWKCFYVEKAEADDLMLVLAKEYSKHEKILIHSPDKDMIQAQRDTNNVDQYSALTRKWLKPEHKHDHMDHWIMEHCMLGDASDGVPKVVDHTEFSAAFLEHLKSYDIDITCPYELRNSDHPNKREALGSFNIQKKNRKGEETGVLDVYKDMRFGASTLKKTIEKHGSLDAFLDSHPLYREHYERNFTLVMEEGIPEYIREATLQSYNTAETNYNKDEFDKYLLGKNLLMVQMELSKVFTPTETISIDNCGWN